MAFSQWLGNSQSRFPEAAGRADWQWHSLGTVFTVLPCLAQKYRGKLQRRSSRRILCGKKLKELENGWPWAREARLPHELSEVLMLGILLDQLHLYSRSEANNKCCHSHGFIWCNDCDVCSQVIFLLKLYPLLYFLSLKDEEIAAQAAKGIAPGVSVV